VSSSLTVVLTELDDEPKERNTGGMIVVPVKEILIFCVILLDAAVTTASPVLVSEIREIVRTPESSGVLSRYSYSPFGNLPIVVLNLTDVPSSTGFLDAYDRCLPGLRTVPG